ncbi:methyltransferase [Burkholderia sp. ABCPW 14]|uniref:class I SAM-dependent methyltransferase n=1 Tax=Burkholderia sp. ABCPW 14 TaxID=1637860 RepID=UPI000770CF91|nr:methyltransferase [Burkholderia sp. ABCPW 14]KVD72426.1 methyltransferase [Burkholderia sp. ABCPW 14]
MDIRNGAIASHNKINIGCGYDKRPDYLNVDMDPTCQPDILITDNNLSELPRKQFSELLAKDVIEHIPRAETANAILEWADLIAPGGALNLETSSILGVAELIRQHQNYADQEKFTSFLFGNQVHAGDFHYTGFTESTLKAHVIAAGFEIDEFKLVDRWLFAVRASKQTDWTRLIETTAGEPNRAFIDIAYREILFREPEAFFFEIDLAALDGGTYTRRDFLKKLYASEERRLRVAMRHGL